MVVAAAQLWPPPASSLSVSLSPSHPRPRLFNLSTLWRHPFPPAVVEPQLQDWVAWRHHPWCLFDDSRHLVAQAKVMGGPCLPCRLRARRCARVGQGGDRGRSQPAPTRSARAGDAPRMATHHCARDRCACVTPRSSRLARLSQAVACKGSTPGWTVSSRAGSCVHAGPQRWACGARCRHGVHGQRRTTNCTSFASDRACHACARTAMRAYVRAAHAPTRPPRVVACV